jgi:SAM-dependent methyltransferase
MTTSAGYRNPWIPERVHRVLEQESGSILDVGGGAAPYYRASHILDFQSFRPDALQANAWGRPRDNNQERCSGQCCWSEQQYTQLDLCAGEKWPFDDNQFDLGLSSHALEDLRDPLPAVRELARVSRRVLIVTPSRLLEQTKGIDHPAYCGFHHHPWMVFEENGVLVFRRKTGVVMLRGCHIRCPLGKTLRVEDGAMVFEGAEVAAEERVFWKQAEDAADYRAFVEAQPGQSDLFVPDGRKYSIRERLGILRRSWQNEL